MYKKVDDMRFRAKKEHHYWVLFRSVCNFPFDLIKEVSYVFIYLISLFA